jgi:hypothetical protein
LVEPGIKDGRLVVQGNVWLSELLNLTDYYHSKKFAMTMMPLHEFQALNISSSFDICLDKENNATKSCGTIPCDYKKSSSTNLTAAVQASLRGPVVLKVHGLWWESLMNMGVEINKDGVTKRLHDRKKSNHVRGQLKFRESLFRLADSALQLMGIGSEFAIIHWRAEIPNINYMECAESIVKAKDSMLMASPNSSFLLMSSLSASHSTSMQGWGGAQSMSQNTTAQQALNYLMNDHAFRKLDQVFQALDIKDWIIAVALDLIMAQKSTHFATCTRGCERSQYSYCLKCNYAGSFALTALQMRKEYTTIGTYPCWPVSIDTKLV